MGDRGNIIIRTEGNPDLYLYTHWSGSLLHEVAQRALRVRERWDDDQYLARIVFQEMLDGDEGTTGFGISTYQPDGEDRVVLDVTAQQVHIGTQTWSFSEYADLDHLTFAPTYPRPKNVSA